MRGRSILLLRTILCHGRVGSLPHLVDLLEAIEGARLLLAEPCFMLRTLPLDQLVLELGRGG